MDFWDALSYLAWAVSVLIFVWILVDALRVGREYEEDFLLSSREGEE
jgi:hypothetical protein